MKSSTNNRTHSFALPIFLLAGVFLSGCESAKKTAEAPPTPVTVAEVQEYSGMEGVNYSATIVPYQQLPVSFKSAGYVDRFCSARVSTAACAICSRAIG